MTQNPADPAWGRSVGAVAAGFLCTALLSVGTDAFLHARGIFPPTGQAMSDGLFVLAAAYRLVFTVLGGYMTAGLAPRRPMTHVVILGKQVVIVQLRHAIDFGLRNARTQGPFRKKRFRGRKYAIKFH